MNARLLLAALMTLTMAGGALAQTVYRCGADGRSYSQQPCAEGRAVALGDARSDLERREGEDAAGRQMRLARTMERERLAAPSLPAKPAGFDRPAPRADGAGATAKDKKSFQAVDRPPKQKKAKRRAA